MLLCTDDLINSEVNSDLLNCFQLPLQIIFTILGKKIKMHFFLIFFIRTKDHFSLFHRDQNITKRPYEPFKYITGKPHIFRVMLNLRQSVQDIGYFLFPPLPNIFDDFSKAQQGSPVNPFLHRVNMTGKSCKLVL